MTVPVSASLTLGRYSYTTGAGAAGFTHAQLPGTNCVAGDSGFTQFSLNRIQSPADTPWSLNTGGVLIVSYRDDLVRDAFPETPSAPFGALVFYTRPSFADTWTFNGSIDLQAVDQSTAIPEPGTLTLFGIGLAAAVRRARHGRRTAAGPAHSA